MTPYYHGIVLSFPNYYAAVPSDGSSQFLAVKGLEAGGMSPAYLILGAIDNQTPESFQQSKMQILNRMISANPNAAVRSTQEDCSIAGYPAAGLAGTYQDDNGTREQVSYVIYIRIPTSFFLTARQRLQTCREHGFYRGNPIRAILVLSKGQTPKSHRTS